jgi:hypothetical protein
MGLLTLCLLAIPATVPQAIAVDTSTAGRPADRHCSRADPARSPALAESPHALPSSHPRTLTTRSSLFSPEFAPRPVSGVHVQHRNDD